MTCTRNVLHHIKLKASLSAGKGPSEAFNRRYFSNQNTLRKTNIGSRQEAPAIRHDTGQIVSTTNGIGPRGACIMHPMPPVLPTFLAVYALLYAAFGVQSPFLAALLHEQGLRAEEIGIVLVASTSIRVLAGAAVGHVADRL